jgi:NADH-quinone oxidoreductase subunit J
MELLFFYIFAAVAIGSAVMVVTNKNVLHAALFLILTFFCVAAIYIILRAEFLAAVQVLLYVGAIMALFIFTILLINVMQAQFLRQFHGQRPLAAVLVAALAVEAIFLLLSDFRGNFPLMRETPSESLGHVGLQTLSNLLLTDYLLVFEVAAVLLLAALIGAVVLARGETTTAEGGR